MKYLSNKKGFLGIDNKFNFKEKVVVVPFGLEKTVSYGGGTKNGPKEIIKASHQVELYDEELNCEPYRKIGIKTLKPFKIDKNINKALKKMADINKEILDKNHALVGKRVEIILGPKSGITGVVEGRQGNRRWRIRCDTNMGHSRMSFPKAHFKEIMSDVLEEKEEDASDSGNEDVLTSTSSVMSKENDTPPPQTPAPFSAVTPVVSTPLSTSLDTYIAKWKYKARDSDELEMIKGDVVNILSRETKWGPDWWKGQIDDRVGLFPKTYVVPFKN